MRKKHKKFKSKLHRKFACLSFNHMENQHEHKLAFIENKKNSRTQACNVYFGRSTPHASAGSGLACCSPCHREPAFEAS
jgi:hypothetical protein